MALIRIFEAPGILEAPSYGTPLRSSNKDSIIGVDVITRYKTVTGVKTNPHAGLVRYPVDNFRQLIEPVTEIGALASRVLYYLSHLAGRAKQPRA